jgi:hypothetical protein
VPWKNGGGTTTEVAVYPPGAGFDDFGWRVSIADVRHGGPFSLFPGIDRCLAVLKGAMTLTIADRQLVMVSPETPPALFSGDDGTVAALAGGTVVDLNVMTRRGAFAAGVSKRLLAENFTLKSTTTCIALALTEFAIASHALTAHDAVLAEAGEEFAFPAGAAFYWIELTAQNR